MSSVQDTDILTLDLDPHPRRTATSAVTAVTPAMHLSCYKAAFIHIALPAYFCWWSTCISNSKWWRYTVQHSYALPWAHRAVLASFVQACVGNRCTAGSALVWPHVGSHQRSQFFFHTGCMSSYFLALGRSKTYISESMHFCDTGHCLNAGLLDGRKSICIRKVMRSVCSTKLFRGFPRS